ncbi:MAG: hypothetical protein DSY80_01505 [Desulfocapsa sp.]|nr:MAG: hypothetical protein DSY80_01505 [Desulfocapsa sp.]
MTIKRHGKSATTNLKQRFFLWSSLILIGGGMLLSLLSFWNTRRLIMAEAMDKSEVLLQEVEAIRSYVKKELRPKMTEMHGRDAFIIEAMSTTYISVSIMDTFARSMPDYTYRRASFNPLNPRNLANPFEEKMLDWFEEDRSRTFYQGIMKKNGESFYVSMIPDYLGKPCLRCHGKVEDAPQSLIDRYGKSSGFRFQEGDLAGIDSVAIPVSASLRAAWQGGLVLFLITVPASLLLLWLLNLLFQHLVIERLGAMLLLVKPGDKEDGSEQPGDELDALHASLGSLQQFVHTAQKGSALQPNFINDYVAGIPISAGAMSWLYSGYTAKTVNKETISMKIGFDDVLQNPLYRACYETELYLFETLSHSCLPAFRERIEDVVILDAVQGKSLASLFEKGALLDTQLRTVFSQLCELTAHMHANGVVHHDLRPQIMHVDTDGKLTLTDLGLASCDRRPDPITAAGLGPQGDLLYMAPEQIQGKRSDPRSDIYTIGILLYQANTGKLPFSSKRRSMQNLLLQKEQFGKHREDTGIQAEMIDIIIKALSANPGKRYQWVEDMHEDLLRVLH